MRLINVDDFVEWLLSDAITDEQRQFAEKVRYAAERMPSATDINVGGTDCISRSDVIALAEEVENKRLKGEIDLTYAPMINGIKALPSAQTELENKIRAIGYTGREGRIYIGGRLFAVRELPQ